MDKCKYCKDFNEEQESIDIHTIRLESSGYYNYDCPIRYCPYCGTILKKYEANIKNN
jgi:hypothetical protein